MRTTKCRIWITIEGREVVVEVIKNDNRKWQDTNDEGENDDEKSQRRTQLEQRRLALHTASREDRADRIGLNGCCNIFWETIRKSGSTVLRMMMMMMARVDCWW